MECGECPFSPGVGNEDYLLMKCSANEKLILNCCTFFFFFLKADVVLKFVDEEAPATIQPKTLYVPKPEIQVITFTAWEIKQHAVAINPAV